MSHLVGSAILLLEQPVKQREHRTNEETRHDAKVKTEIASSVVNVAGQPPKPALANSHPEQHTHAGNQQSDHHQDLSELVHSFNTKPMFANWREAFTPLCRPRSGMTPNV